MGTDWLQWYYLIYLVPLALALVTLLMSGLGGRHSARGHSGVAHGGPGHLGPLHVGSAHVASAHVGSAHGGIAHGGPVHGGPARGGPVRAAARSTTQTEGSPAGGSAPRESFGQHILGSTMTWFGLERAPITLAAGSLFMGWGIAGFLATKFLQPSLPILFIPLALAIAVVGGLLFARIVGGVLGRYMPADESYGVSREELSGLTGTVVYPVSPESGRVHVFDQYGTLHVEAARVRSGRPAIPRGKEVLVVSVDEGRGCLIVDGLDSPEPSGTGRDSAPGAGSTAAVPELASTAASASRGGIESPAESPVSGAG